MENDKINSKNQDFQPIVKKSENSFNFKAIFINIIAVILIISTYTYIEQMISGNEIIFNEIKIKEDKLNHIITENENEMKMKLKRNGMINMASLW